MAEPDEVTVPPPAVLGGSAPGAPMATPLEGTLGAAEGAAAAARPGWVRPTPTSRPVTRPRATPTPRNRDGVDMAGTPWSRTPEDRRVRTTRCDSWPPGSSESHRPED